MTFFHFTLNTLHINALLKKAETQHYCTRHKHDKEAHAAEPKTNGYHNVLDKCPGPATSVRPAPVTYTTTPILKAPG